MTIRGQIYLGFGSVILFIVLFSGAVILAMDSMNDNLHNTDTLYKKLQHIDDIQIEVHRINFATMRWIADGGTEEPLPQLSEARQKMIRVRAELSDLVAHQEGWVYFEQAMADYDALLSAVDEMFRLQADSGIEASKAYFENTVQPLEHVLTENLIKFEKYQEDMLSEGVLQSERRTMVARNFVWAGILALTALCVFTAQGVVRRTLRSIRSISSVMESVHKLDSSESMPRMESPGNDETAAIVRAFNLLADSLEERAAQEKEYRSRLEEQHWIKSSIATVMDACQSAKSPDVFGERLLALAAPAVGAATAALYYADSSEPFQRYRRIACYAIEPKDETWVDSFRPGEGLIGQCAADGCMTERTAPPGYLRVVSGVGAADAAYLLLVPIRFENDVTAVIEFGSFQPFRPLAKQFLAELAGGSLGILLQSISSYVRVQHLLSESQSYVEELQSQQEELQQQQEELRSLNEKLAEQFRTSEQRSEELERIRLELEERTKALEASSQFKSEFLANMSHELRTPLNSLLILAQMLADDAEGRLSEKQKDYAHTILQSGHSLLELINDVLDLAKIEAGQLDRSDEAFSIAEFAQELERQFAGQAEGKSLEFTVEVEPALTESLYVTDLRMLRQIMNNLLSNAFKFTEAGSVRLRIFKESFPEDAPDTLVAFEVRDTGIGIPRDKHELIFETFRQADGRTNRKYGGTGLGLSISRELSSILGGTIRLESEEGAGSTFTAVLPLKRLDDAMEAEAAALAETAAAAYQPQDEADGNYAAGSEPSPAATAVAAGAPRKGGRQPTVLLVDDDIRNVFALSAALIENGYEVAFAEDGGAALDMLAERTDIDLVLMDMMMPGIDGYEAMRSIRANPRYEKLPIIALTAKAMKQDRELCIEAGASDYLSKPVKLDKLLALLRVWLDGAEKESDS